MNNSELIGKKIKEIRKRKKISQEKLAEMTEMNHRSILRLENSQCTPTIETLEKIAKALNVKVIDFFATETIKSREDLIKDINDCLLAMEDAELQKFYKSVYYFIH